MRNVIVWSLLFLLLTTSCAMNYITFNAESRAKNIELGLSIEEVKGIMGSLFIKDSAYTDDNGDTMETIAYKSDAETEFHFHFRNNVLENWDRKYIPKFPSED